MKMFKPVYRYPLKKSDGWKKLTGDLPVKMTHPEFCATFMMLNKKRPEVVYSEKFVITNIDLTRVELVTKEDKKDKIDQWAEFFKAKTWEDMKMLAEKNESIGRAVSGVWQLTEEEKIRQRCRAREEWIINDNYKTRKLKEQEEELKQKDAALEQKNAALEQKDAALELKDAAISDQKVIIEQLQAKIERLKNMM